MSLTWRHVAKIFISELTSGVLIYSKVLQLFKSQFNVRLVGINFEIDIWIKKIN